MLLLQVSIKYLEQLCEIDEKHSLKLAPRLKLKHLNPSHYEKMNVGTAYAVFNHAVASALRLLVEQGKIDEEALTTAWFVDQVFKWFSLMTSRTPTMALSDLCSEKGKEAVTFLNDFMEVFRNLRIIDKAKTNATWKPIQAGIIITTTTALNLRELYVQSKNLKFLLLSRLCQDALENLFSTIRVKSPVPRAREFKYTLRVIVLAQFFKPSRHGSYDIDDSVQLTDFLSSRPDLAEELGNINMPEEVGDLEPEEQQSLEYVAGYVARNIMKKHKLCESCTALLAQPAKNENRFLALKNYVPDKQSLCTPSENVMHLIECVETYFRENEESLVMGKANIDQVRTLIAAVEPTFTVFPVCHNVADKVVREFLLCRLRFALRAKNEMLQRKAAQNSKCGSKSVGMRAAVSTVK